MRNLFYWLAAGIVFVFGSCSGDHLINDNDYRLKVENDFNERKKLAAARERDLYAAFRSG
jgi:hypothetical protein